MLSEGNQEDWVERLRTLSAWRVALESARRDPCFHGSVKDDRIRHYEQEVAKWEALCNLT